MRTRMITRTVTENTVKAMVVNTQKGEIEYRTLTIVGAYSHKELEKITSEAVEREEWLKFVKMDVQFTIERVYGMTEEDFVSKAEILSTKANI